MFILETPRLIVRRYSLSDTAVFFLLNGNEEVMRYINPVKTKEESDAFLKQVVHLYKQMPAYGRWAVYKKLSGEFLGSFAIIPVEHTDNMQLGYALLKDHWGKGYATELAIHGLQYVFSKTPLQTIYA
jgi:ribosomal-protein-alanine N-acetyltransferase